MIFSVQDKLCQSAPRLYLLQLQKVPQDYSEAMKWYQKAAGSGDSDAMYNIGVLYDNGQGVQRDFSEALKWYQKAAEADYVPAMNKLGIIYNDGLGVQKNYLKAIEWLQKAVDKGDRDAKLRLGIVFENIGKQYDRGIEVQQNFSEAVKWYQKAAEIGLTDAMFNLGQLYYSGQGDYEQKDFDKSNEWFLKAANNGDPEALNAIGNLYLKGFKNPRCVNGIALFSPDEHYNQDAIMRDINRTSTINAAEWYKKAAELGSKNGLMNLLRCCESGLIPRKVYNDAYMHYQDALNGNSIQNRPGNYSGSHPRQISLENFIKLLSEVEKYLQDDNEDIEAASLKLRKADELLANCISSGNNDHTSELKQNIDTMKEMGLISEQQAHIMHLVRMRTNAGVHTDENNPKPTSEELRNLNRRFLVEGRKIIDQVNKKAA